MKGLDPDEREALLNAGWFVMSPAITIKMRKRGLISEGTLIGDGPDRHHVVTGVGWLALRLDTAARRGVSA